VLHCFLFFQEKYYRLIFIGVIISLVINYDRTINIGYVTNSSGIIVFGKALDMLESRLAAVVTINLNYVNQLILICEIDGKYNK